MALETESPILVRRAAARDYPEVARIQALCAEAAQWPVGDYSNYEVLMAFAPEAAGFCAWRQTAPEEAELLNLAVLPAHRRKGVASALLVALGRAACGEIFLEVAEPNAPAIALYHKHGWRATGLRRGYYAGGSIHAVVMKKGSW